MLEIQSHIVIQPDKYQAIIVFRLIFVIVKYLISLWLLQSEMYAGSLFVDQLFGWNMYASTGVLLAITAIYTIAGWFSYIILFLVIDSFPLIDSNVDL